MLVTLSNSPESYTKKNLPNLVTFVQGLAQITDTLFDVAYQAGQAQWVASPHNQNAWQYEDTFHNASYTLHLKNKDYGIYLKFEEYPKIHREGATFEFDYLEFNVEGLPKDAKISGTIRKYEPYQLSLNVITYQSKHETVKQYIAQAVL